MPTPLVVLGSVGFWFWSLWSWSYLIALFLRRGTPAWLIETKYLMYPAIVLKMVIYNVHIYGPSSGWLPIVWACDLYWWYVVRKIDDDDRWKKRRRKAAAKIKEVAGRLVVVPEPVPISTK